MSRRSPVNTSFVKEPVGHLNRTETYTIDINTTFDNAELVPKDVQAEAPHDVNTTFYNGELAPKDVQVEAPDVNTTFDNAALVPKDTQVEASHDKEADSTYVANITGSPPAAASEEVSYHNIDEISTSVIQSSLCDETSPCESQSADMVPDSLSIVIDRESSPTVNAWASPPITVAHKSKSPTPERFRTSSIKDENVIAEKTLASPPIALTRECKKSPTPESAEVQAENVFVEKIPESPPINVPRKSKSPTPERFRTTSIKDQNAVAEKALAPPAIALTHELQKSPTPERFEAKSIKVEKVYDEKTTESPSIALARESKKPPIMPPTPEHVEAPAENVYVQKGFVEKEFVEKTTESPPIAVARQAKSPTPERFKTTSIKDASPPIVLARESKKPPTPDRIEAPVENVYVQMENSFDVQFKKPALPVFKLTPDEFADDEFKTCGSSCKKFKSLSEVCVTHKRSALTNTSARAGNVRMWKCVCGLCCCH